MTSHSRVQRAEEGADPTPTPENMWPTAGQLWHQLLVTSVEERMSRLDRMLDAAAETDWLRFKAHDLRRERDGWRERAQAAEAKVARVKALADEWGDWPLTPIEGEQSADMLRSFRAALDDTQ